MLPRTKILIVEDHDDFRELVRNYLSSQNQEWVLFEADCGTKGIETAKSQRPHIILMDIRLPDINGIDAATEIKVESPETEVIVLTMFESESFKKVFLNDSISVYLGKSELYERLLPELIRIIQKNQITPPLDRSPRPECTGGAET
jgi:two-component system response regulator DegU